MPSKYHRVAVLAIVWEKGDPMFQKGHDQELQNLRSLMQNDFGYEHTEFRIPSEGGRKAQHHVNKAISDHIEQHDGPESLLIIYYSGSSVLVTREDSHDDLYLVPVTRAYPEQGVRWHSAEKALIKSAESDVFTILDCCYSSAAHIGAKYEAVREQTPGRRTYELLSAGVMTRAPGPNSLTTRFIACMRDLLIQHGDEVFSSMELIDRIHARSVASRNDQQRAMIHDRLYRFDGRHIMLGRISAPRPTLSGLPKPIIPLVGTSVNSFRSRSPSLIFDASSNGEGAYPSTNMTSHIASKHQISLPKSSLSPPKNVQGQSIGQTDRFGDADTATSYSVDTSPEDRHLEYLEAFSAKMTEDVRNLCGLRISELPSGTLTSLLQEFAQRLHAEASNPFQWETSVIIHRHREHISRSVGHEAEPEGIFLGDKQSTYSDTDTIATPARPAFVKSQAELSSWVQGVQDVDTDTVEKPPEDTPEPFDSRFIDYEKFVWGSQAYTWLIATTRQRSHLAKVTHSTVDLKTEIGAIVRKSLRQQQPSMHLSRRMAQPPVQLTVTVPRWSLFEIAASFDLKTTPTAVFDRVQCITGSWEEAQLATVREYVSQVWPTTSEPLLELLRNVLSDPARTEHIYQIDGSMNASLSVVIQRPDKYIFDISGSSHVVTDIVEQLAWVTSALQEVPKAAWIAEYRPKVELIPQSSSSKQSDTQTNQMIRLEVERRRVEYKDLDSCIPQLGSSRNFTLVSGYPISGGSPPDDEIDMGQESCHIYPDAIPRGSDLRILRLPQNLQELVATVPKTAVKVGLACRGSWTNTAKLRLESYSGYLWDWKPLATPFRNGKGEHPQVDWTMFGHRLQCETTNTAAESMKSVLEDMTLHPSRCYCCSPRKTQHTWYNTFLGVRHIVFEKVRSYTNGDHSAAAQRYTPTMTGSNNASNTSTTIPTPNTDTTHVVVTSSNAISQPTPLIRHDVSGPQKSLQVLFAVQGLQWSLALESVLLHQEACDSAFFRTLRMFHSIHRPKILNCLSPFRFKSCRCVRLEKASANLVTSSTHQELPDDARYSSLYAARYEYYPRPPDTVPPLIDPRMYQILLSECHTLCFWSLLPWHFCIHLDQGSTHLNKLPKLKGLSTPLRETGDVAFGLEADYMLSFRILTAYHLLTIVPAFIFWGYWMARHPGDLQNASVPLMTVLALITVFWIMMGKRVGIS